MTIKIESLDYQGRGITHLDGKIVFIPNALPGEELEIKIIEDKKNYAVGEIVKYLSESKNRIKPICPYYKECGGCHLSHMDYDNQIKYKQNTLIEIIKRYASINIAPEVIISPKDYEYRNKITLKIINSKWGYYSESTHNFIPIKECIIAKESINKIIKDKNLFDIKNGEIAIKSNYNDEILISITSEEEPIIDIDSLAASNKIIGIVVNNKIYYGENKFVEIINSRLFQVSYNSFFQINIDILSEVFNILNQKKYKNVLDLYCGVGTFGIAINKKKLYGIELSASSIKNALINNKMNNQDNLFILGDSSKIRDIEEKIDTLIIDPPRSGVNTKTINNILDKKPEEIIYMSCNPLTLARDLNILKESYNIEKAYLLDMFPQTYHIECLVILSDIKK